MTDHPLARRGRFQRRRRPYGPQQRRQVLPTPTRNAARDYAEGSLLLGYHEHGALRYAGSFGTGWDMRTGADLQKRLSSIEVDEPALAPSDVKPGRWSKRKPGRERWVRPEMVVEIEFIERTPEGHVRHPSYRGVRLDKPAPDVVREGKP